MQTVQQLEAEIRRLRRKLAPLEDGVFTERFRHSVTPYIVSRFGRADFRGVDHYWVSPRELWVDMFGEGPTLHDTAKLGQTLRALGWVPTAKSGVRYFIIPVAEYHEQIR